MRFTAKYSLSQQKKNVRKNNPMWMTIMSTVRVYCVQTLRHTIVKSFPGDKSTVVLGKSTEKDARGNTTTTARFCG